MKRIGKKTAAFAVSACMLVSASAYSELSLQIGGNGAVVAAAAQRDDDLVLRYTSSAGTHSTGNAWDNAESFYRALPIGNGRIGAMVYGNCPDELIDLNECTIWSSGPSNNNREGAASHLGEVQSLIADGKLKEANDIIGRYMIGGGMAKYQMVGTLKLMTGHENVTGYTRELDMNDAVTRTKYTCNGKQYTRETFVSHPDNVMVTRITCNAVGSVSLTAGYQDILNGSVSTDGGDTLVANGHGDDDNFVRGAVYFSTRSKFIPTGGSVSANNGRVTVSNADSVLILTSVRTNYIDASTCNGDEKGDAAKDIAAVERRTYDSLYDAHEADFSELFHRVDVDLGGDSAVSNAKTMETRIDEFSKTNDPKMVKVLFQYGRYLMISASRDAQPMNLQGIWNRYSAPAWGSKATTNINYEMNYWPAFTTNLAECFEPFVEKAKSLQQNGAETAMVHYGISDGWVLHHNTDLWNRTGPIDGTWGQWPTGGAWVCNMLYDAYRFNQDKAYLNEIYPVIRGSASFLSQIMTKQSIAGQEYAVISPSASPELPIPGYAWDDNVYCSVSVTMDNAITRELFADITEASAILGKDALFRDTIQSQLSLIRPEFIGKWGQIQEWAQDLDNPNETHRHISHLYGVYPGGMIDPSANATVAEAAKTTLNGRGDAGTGWSEAWKLNCWARLCDGEHAYNLVKLLITPVNGTESGRLYANLWDAHPPFQIDGNFGFTSGVAEMLLQSHNDCIHLLPALPEAWSTGHANGLCARGNFEVSEMNWEGGLLTGAAITSKSGGVCHVRYRNMDITFDTEKGKTYYLDGTLTLLDEADTMTNLAKGKKITASGANAGEIAAMAIDGSAATKWCHDDGIGGEWLTVDLGKDTELGRWTATFAGTLDGIEYNPRDFLLQACDDGETWQTVDAIYGNTKTNISRNIGFSARYVRLYFVTATQNNKGGARVCEFGVYGTGGAPDARSAYEKIDADSFALTSSDIQIEYLDDGTTDIGFITPNSYAMYKMLDFETGAEGFRAEVSSGSDGGTIELRAGSPTGTLLGSVDVPPTGSWTEFTNVECAVKDCVGVKSIYLVFTGESNFLLNVRSFSFYGIAGDMDGDRALTAKDMTIRKRLELDPDLPLTPLGRSNADFNGDGRLDSKDVTALNKFLLAQ